MLSRAYTGVSRHARTNVETLSYTASVIKHLSMCFTALKLGILNTDICNPVFAVVKNSVPEHRASFIYANTSVLKHAM